MNNRDADDKTQSVKAAKRRSRNEIRYFHSARLVVNEHNKFNVESDSGMCSPNTQRSPDLWNATFDLFLSLNGSRILRKRIVQIYAMNKSERNLDRKVDKRKPSKLRVPKASLIFLTEWHKSKTRQFYTSHPLLRVNWQAWLKRENWIRDGKKKKILFSISGTVLCWQPRARTRSSASSTPGTAMSSDRGSATGGQRPAR